MRNHVGALVGTDNMGDLVLDLLTGSLAPTTCNNYGTGIVTINIFLRRRRYHPATCYCCRHAALYIMARPTARAGTVVACSLQPYF
jgi:hypothetical protein